MSLTTRSSARFSTSKKLLTSVALVGSLFGLAACCGGDAEGSADAADPTDPADAADRDKLFMPYYSTKLRGSGLGLAIVRRIVAEPGGNIEAADETPRGTRFVIELPL